MIIRTFTFICLLAAYCLLPAACFFLLPTSNSFSQPVENIEYFKPQQLKKLIENALSFGDVYSAIDIYERYVQAKPDDNNALWELAELYRKTRNYRKAADAFNKLYEKDAKANSKALFYYGQMQKSLGDYEGAKASFLKFQKENKGGSANDFKKILKTELDGCEMGIAEAKPEKASLKAEIKHLNASINKAHIEFSPLLIDDNRLLYGSLRTDSLQYYSTENPNPQKPLRKFFTAKKINGNWEFEDEFKTFNSNRHNVGNGIFSADGNKFYFSICEADWHNKVHCKIYMSKKEGETWTEPEELGGGINDANNSTMPALGQDAKKKTEILYFVSDRQGGVGKKDIWFSIYDDKKQQWSAPKNLGNKLNTEEDEITPFYDIKTHTLYFSSEGYAGFGGMDVFKANGEMSKWSKPENVGYPINTGADEVYYTVNPKDRETGFFTSNRMGGTALHNPTCCDDIYEYRWKDFKNIVIRGKLYDADFVESLLEMDDVKQKHDLMNDEERYMLDSAIVSVYLIEKDNDEAILISTDTSNEKGEYSFKLEKEKDYKIVVNKNRYYSKHYKFTTKNITAETIDQNIGLSLIQREPVIIKNIYYEYDDASLNTQSKKVIDTTLFLVLRNNPQIVVEISSHTDSKGSHDYNIALSQKRAESVVNYLVSKGIDKNRLQPKGYGETKPISPNENKDGSDNPDGRARNRRTEFKIIGTLDSDKYEEIIYKD